MAGLSEARIKGLGISPVDGLAAAQPLRRRSKSFTLGGQCYWAGASNEQVVEAAVFKRARTENWTFCAVETSGTTNNIKFLGSLDQERMWAAASQPAPSSASVASHWR